MAMSASCRLTSHMYMFIFQWLLCQCCLSVDIHPPQSLFLDKRMFLTEIQLRLFSCLSACWSQPSSSSAPKIELSHSTVCFVPAAMLNVSHCTMGALQDFSLNFPVLEDFSSSLTEIPTSEENWCLFPCATIAMGPMITVSDLCMGLLSPSCGSYVSLFPCKFILN